MIECVLCYCSLLLNLYLYTSVGTQSTAIYCATAVVLLVLALKTTASCQVFNDDYRIFLRCSRYGWLAELMNNWRCVDRAKLCVSLEIFKKN